MHRTEFNRRRLGTELSIIVPPETALDVLRNNIADGDPHDQNVQDLVLQILTNDKHLMADVINLINNK